MAGAAIGIGWRRNQLLKIIDPIDKLLHGHRQRLRKSELTHAQALRSEQGFDHQLLLIGLRLLPNLLCLLPGFAHPSGRRLDAMHTK